MASLAKSEPRERARLLARASRVLLPSPRASDEAYGIVGEKAIEALEEIADEYDLDWRTISADRVRLLEVITNEMSAATSVGKNRLEIKSRLGQSGDLLPESYDVSFDDVFRKLAKETHISGGEVRGAIRHADDAQHLFPERNGGEEPNTFSIFVKEQFEANDSFLWIVFGRRKGYELTVTGCFKLFVSEVNLSKAKSPLDVLRLFVDVYGLPITIRGKKETSKFVLYELFQLDKKPNGEVVLLEGNAPGPHMIFVLGRHFGDSDMHEIGMAFAINMRTYKEALRDHGIRVR